jgi:NADPH:quinone reductase-like Zn-dependent oxidoreductase
MKAYQLPSGPGADEPRMVELPDPTPGPGQVLVRMKAASLNFRDLVIEGKARERGLDRPLIPLSDGAGEVIATGDGAGRFKPGDRVAAGFMQTWIDGPYHEAYGASALGGAIDGVLAEQGVFAERGLVRVPEHLSWEEAATLPCAALTAWNAMFATGDLRPGETVLVLGSGGVAVFALQFARLAGAQVVATSSSDAKLERLRALGANRLINYKADPEWGNTVRKLTGGGVDQVIEVGGAGTLEQSLRAVRAGGTVSLIGILAGGGDFQPNRIFAKTIRLQGIYVGSVAMFEAMNRAIAGASLKPVIDRVFPFAEAAAAYRHLQSGSHFGKVVVGID